MTNWSGRTWSPPLAAPGYRQQVWERLTAKVRVLDSGCWFYTGYRSRDGYGHISVKSRMPSAHQVALAINRGGIWPSTLQVDHLSGLRACCNPDHLELVTPRENTIRGYGPNLLAGFQRTKTHCPQGHEFDEENTYVHPVTGHRNCRACRRIGMRTGSRVPA